MYDRMTARETVTAPHASESTGQCARRRTECQRPSLAQRQEQFAALASSVSDALHNAALRWGGNRAHAEDLVQDTLLCAWRNFDRFAIGTSFKAWVFQMLRYIVCNKRRGAASRQLTVDFQADESLLGTGLQEERHIEPFNTDWESVFPDVLDDTLKHALDCLTPTQRTVALCIPLGGLSYRECADELGIPVGTVMSRYWRARTVLRQELRRNGDG